MVASPRYEFPSPLDHAPQSALRYAALKIRCHLKEKEKRKKNVYKNGEKT